MSSNCSDYDSDEVVEKNRYMKVTGNEKDYFLLLVDIGTRAGILAMNHANYRSMLIELPEAHLCPFPFLK